MLSIILYIVIGIFWLPVVVMQMKMRDLAEAAERADAPLPPGIACSSGPGSSSAFRPSQRSLPSYGS